MANVTSKTYGPGGRTVCLEYENGDPKITKDGVTVAKSVFFKDREHELGAKLLKRISDSTNTFCGDGTTLATFFSTTLIEKSIIAVSYGIHPTSLKNGIEKAKNSALEIIKQFSIPVTNEKELYDVCMVSSNYDEVIADITSRAINSIDST
jgi:chaperonin GroEL